MIILTDISEWHALRDLKKKINKNLIFSESNPGLSFRKQLKYIISTIMSAFRKLYYSNSEKEFNLYLRDFKHHYSTLTIYLKRISQQQPKFMQICNRLKKEIREIKKSITVDLQSFGEPNTNSSLFKQYVSFRERDIEDSKLRFEKSHLRMMQGRLIKGIGLYSCKLKIADIIIRIDSRFKGALFIKEDSWRFNNFLYKVNKNPHIVLNVKVVNKLPMLKGAKRLFTTIHPDSNNVNWSIYQKDGQYILRNQVEEKKQYVELNLAFDRGIVYIESNKQTVPQWNLTDIIYDALQIILIAYFAKRDGVFLHATGIKDIANKGVIFIGKSKSGKTTLARLWHKHSRAIILNDDRIIVRKINGKFLMYGTPWHGDFNDYLISKMDSVKLPRLLFIHHAKKNRLRCISSRKAFSLLYPNIFPALWDREGIKRALFFSENLVSKLSCCMLGFKKDKEIIGFIRRIK